MLRLPHLRGGFNTQQQQGNTPVEDGSLCKGGQRVSEKSPLSARCQVAALVLIRLCRPRGSVASIRVRSYRSRINAP